MTFGETYSHLLVVDHLRANIYVQKYMQCSLFPIEHSVITVARNYRMKIKCYDWNTSKCKEFIDSLEGN